MPEMLANRYFRSGRFGEAAMIYEGVLRRYPGHLPARKKLVVSYVALGRLREALELALGLLDEGLEVLAVSDPETEGFPCGDVQSVLRGTEPMLPPGVRHTSLALLQLFCRPEEALRELDLAVNAEPVIPDAPRLRSALKRHLEARHV